MTDGLEFHCTRCGGKAFEMPEHPHDDDVVTCSGCNARGRYGDLRNKMVDLAKKHVDDMVGKALGPLFKKR